MKRSAEISACGTYRFMLERDWLDELGLYANSPERLYSVAERTVAFVMLNPSTADAEVDDPTIRRCIGFAKEWGFTRLLVANAFALRATDPSKLGMHEAPIGNPRNTEVLRALPSQAALIICAWGVMGELRSANTFVRRDLHDGGATHERVCHLGLTKGGHPKHPLYLPKSVLPEPWGLAR